MEAGRRKRKYCEVETASLPPQKRLRLNYSVSGDGEQRTHTHAQHLPCNVTELSYQMYLYLLCLMKRKTIQCKYPFILKFEDYKISEFGNVVFYSEDQSIHVHVECVDKYYERNLTYDRLFAQGKGSFSLNQFFNSFAECRISDVHNLSPTISHLVIFTNAGLDLSEEKKLKKRRMRKFHPLKFTTFNISDCDVLKDFLYFSQDINQCACFQFSKDVTTQEGLLEMLQVSSKVRKVLQMRKDDESEDKLKEEFLDKLVFLVDQPEREQLNGILRKTIESNKELQYNELRMELFNNIKSAQNVNIRNSKLGVLSKFNLFLSLLNDMFLAKNMISLKLEVNKICLSDYICVNYDCKNISFVVFDKYCYNQPRRRKLHQSCQGILDSVFINECFSLFLEELKQRNNLEHFIVFTNIVFNSSVCAELLTQSGKHLLKFQEVEHPMFRNFSCISGKAYQLCEGETRQELIKLMDPGQNMLNHHVQYQNEHDAKEQFLNKLIVVPDMKALNIEIVDKVQRDYMSGLVPYTFDEFCEIALHCYERYHITKPLMVKTLGDMKDGHSSAKNLCANEEIAAVAKGLVRSEGVPAFYQLYDIIIQRLYVLEYNCVCLKNMSSVLNGSKGSAPKAFLDLYNLWFDDCGNKKMYLKCLEKAGINISSICGILNGAGVGGARAFKALFQVWFHENGKEKPCLISLKEEGVDLTVMSNILRGSRAHAAQAFEKLYKMWFNEKGCKTLYLRAIQSANLDLRTVSSLLSGTGANASRTFLELYKLWFDEKGHKTPLLTVLLNSGVSLSAVTNILKGSGSNCAELFKEMYDLWFDESGNKTTFLKNLEKAGLGLRKLSVILSGSGKKCIQTLKKLNNLFFDDEGNKKQMLKNILNSDVTLRDISQILAYAGASAVDSLKDLCDLWFDECGSATVYLKSLSKERVDFFTVCSIFNGSRGNAAKAFKDLYLVWFDKQGHKRQCLKAIQKNEVPLNMMCKILQRSGSDAAQTFKELFRLWYNERGNETMYLQHLKDSGAELHQFCMVLGGAGKLAPKAFKDFHDLWFDEVGDKNQLAVNLEKVGISLSTVCYILSCTGSKAAKSLYEFYCCCFDENGEKSKYLKSFCEEKLVLGDIANVFFGAGLEASGTFKRFVKLLFKRRGKKTENYFQSVLSAGINLKHLSMILEGSRSRASEALRRLYCLWFDKQGNKTVYLTAIEENKFPISKLCSVAYRSGIKAADKIKTLMDFFFNRRGLYEEKIQCLSSISRGNSVKVLIEFHSVLFDGSGIASQYYKFIKSENIDISDLAAIVKGAGTTIVKVCQDLYVLWVDADGQKTPYLQNLERVGLNLKSLSCMLRGSGKDAANSFKEFHDLWFDEEGNKTLNLMTLEKLEFPLPRLLTIVYHAGSETANAIKKLLYVWFDEEGNKTKYLRNFEDLGINISELAQILWRSGCSAQKSFMELHNVLFEKTGKPTKLLETLEKEGINGSVIVDILKKSGVNAPQVLREVYCASFSENGCKTKHLINLEGEGLSLLNVCRMLLHTQSKWDKALKKLHDAWFDEEGNKTLAVETLQAEGVQLIHICEILNETGEDVGKVFNQLYRLWFDEQGQKTHFVTRLERDGITLSMMSSLLKNQGKNADNSFIKMFNRLYDVNGTKTQYFDKIVEGISEHSLNTSVSHSEHEMSYIDVNDDCMMCRLCYLSGKEDLIEDFVCDDDDKDITELLEIFYRRGFKRTHLQCILQGTIMTKLPELKTLFFVCFKSKEGEVSEILNNFFSSSFQPGDICRMLSGAPTSIRAFHNFCFVDGNEKLNHFLKAQFIPKDLSLIFHGAQANVCSALANFHQVCFNKKGKKSTLLTNFLKVGLYPQHLSKLLALSGQTAASTLIMFHEVCFNRNYLFHFAAQKEIFTANVFSKILYGAGENLPLHMEKLHHICFEQTGNQSVYFSDLNANHPPEQVLHLLREELKKQTTSPPL